MAGVVNRQLRSEVNGKTGIQKVLGSNPGWILRFFLFPLTSLLNYLFTSRNLSVKT